MVQPQASEKRKSDTCVGDAAEEVALDSLQSDEEMQDMKRKGKSSKVSIEAPRSPRGSGRSDDAREGSKNRNS